MKPIKNLPRSPLTATQRKRATYDRLVASLPVPQYTSIRTAQPAKASPATGVFGSV